MKVLPWLLAIVLTGSTVSVSLVQGFPSLDLNLGKPAYRESWNALFRGEKNVDAWLVHYARTKDGPTSATETVHLGGIPYQLNSVCKTHDCGANFFVVLFAPNGAKAWGLLWKDYKNERFFGRPDDEKKHALRAIIKCSETGHLVCNGDTETFEATRVGTLAESKESATSKGQAEKQNGVAGGTSPRLGIPKQFHGSWDEPSDRCKLGSESDSRIRVTSNEISYYEASCSLKKGITSETYRFSGRFDCEGEGNKAFS